MQMWKNQVVTMVTRKMAKRKSRKSSKFSEAIRALQRMKGNQRYNAIRHANDKFIREIVSHVRSLRTNKLSPQQRKLLKRHTTKLRFISNPKITLQRKRKNVSQKGGFLSAILPMLAPVVGDVLGNICGFKR